MRRSASRGVFFFGRAATPRVVIGARCVSALARRTCLSQLPGRRRSVRHLGVSKTGAEQPQNAQAIHDAGLALLDAGDTAAAAALFRKATALGHPEAAFFFGLHHGGLLSDGAAKDSKRALELYELAASRGHVPAMFNAALAYRLGDGTERDLDKALEWYSEARRLAANAGDGRAAFSLGLSADPHHPDMSLGLEPDADAAEKWYRLAIDAGHERAKVNLGILHWHPIGLELAKVPQAERRATALDLWQQAADAGVPEARDCLRQAADVDKE